MLVNVTRSESKFRVVSRSLVAGWILVPVITLGCWGLSSYFAGRHLGRARAGLRELGLGTRAEDFARAAVADEENAAVYFQRAGLAASGVDSPSTSSDSFETSYVPYPPIWWKHADASARANARVFQLAVEGARKSRSDMGAIKSYQAVLPPLNRYRHVCNLIADESLRRHFVGDDEGYFELFEAGGTLVNSAADEPSISCWLAGMGMDSMRCSQIAIVAAQLRVGSGPGEATPQRVRLAIAELLEPRSEQVCRVIAYDPIASAEMFEPVFRRAYLTGAVETHLSAVFSEQAAASVREIRGMPAVEPGWREFDLPQTWGPSKSVYDRLPLILHRQEFYRRGGAIAFACALYRADHNGAWPGSLDALVPSYLPVAPVDPMSKSGSALVYRLADGGRRPVVLGVGETSVDVTKMSDQFLAPPPVYQPEWRHRTAVPWLMDLALFPAPPASTQPAN